MLTLIFANNSPGIPFNYQGQPDLFITTDSTKNVLTITITNYDTVPQTLTPGQATLTITPPTTLYPTTASMQLVTASSPWTTIVNGGVYPNWTLTLSGETSIIIPASGGFLTLTLSGITVASTIHSGSCEFWQCSWSNFGTENGNAYPDSFIYDLPTAPNAQFQADFMNGTAEVTVNSPTSLIASMASVMGVGYDNSVLTTIPSTNPLLTSLQFSLYSPQGEQISFTSSSQFTFVIPGCPNGIPDYSTLCYQEDLVSINLAASSVSQPTLVQNAQGNNSRWKYTPAVGTMGTTSIDFTLSGLKSNLTTQNRTVVLYMSYTGIPGFADGLVMLITNIIAPSGCMMISVDGVLLPNDPSLRDEPSGPLDVCLNQIVKIGWNSVGMQNLYLETSPTNTPLGLYGTHKVSPFPSSSNTNPVSYKLGGAGFNGPIYQTLTMYFHTLQINSYGNEAGGNVITINNPFYKATVYWDIQFYTSIQIQDASGSTIYTYIPENPSDGSGSYSFSIYNYVAILQNEPGSLNFQIVVDGYPPAPAPLPFTVAYGSAVQLSGISEDYKPFVKMSWYLGDSGYDKLSTSVTYYLEHIDYSTGPYTLPIEGIGASGIQNYPLGLGGIGANITSTTPITVTNSQTGATLIFNNPLS